MECTYRRSRRLSSAEVPAGGSTPRRSLRTCTGCVPTAGRTRASFGRKPGLRRRNMAEDAVYNLIEWGKAEADAGNAFYLFWHPGVPWSEVECIAPADLTPSLQGIGANCTKLYNWLLRWLKAEGLADVDAVGGTGDYYN